MNRFLHHKSQPKERCRDLVLEIISSVSFVLEISGNKWLKTVWNFNHLDCSIRTLTLMMRRKKIRSPQYLFLCFLLFFFLASSLVSPSVSGSVPLRLLCVVPLNTLLNLHRRVTSGCLCTSQKCCWKNIHLFCCLLKMTVHPNMKIICWFCLLTLMEAHFSPNKEKYNAFVNNKYDTKSQNYEMKSWNYNLMSKLTWH